MSRFSSYLCLLLRRSWAHFSNVGQQVQPSATSAHRRRGKSSLGRTGHAEDRADFVAFFRCGSSGAARCRGQGRPYIFSFGAGSTTTPLGAGRPTTSAHFSGNEEGFDDPLLRSSLRLCWTDTAHRAARRWAFSRLLLGVRISRTDNHGLLDTPDRSVCHYIGISW